MSNFDKHANSIHLDKVQNYYSKVLQSTADLKSSACCSTETVPEHIKPILSKIHSEVVSRFYGCGIPVPPAAEGCTALDLGCGTGRDVFLLSAQVGPQGRVIGIDMTDDQLAVARRHVEFHTKEFGFAAPNVDFRKGFIEDLRHADIADNSIDLVVSNCVINLSPAKRQVFSEIMRVLKPGGELFFSDIFCDRRLPEECSNDPVLLGECLGGAMYKEDFRRLMSELGQPDLRVMSSTEVTTHDPTIKRKIGNARFFSITFRVLKVPLEDRCEDYGQVARYKGTIPFAPHGFMLDNHHFFETGRPLPICRNTANMLTFSRYKQHFAIDGEAKQHFGIFDCGPKDPVSNASTTNNNGSTQTGSCC